jgi:carboxymethylenebutenolidase
MLEHHIDIPTADGAMNTFVVHPEENGPHPVVLFYMDAPGKREELHDMARRIATTGYFVVLPNLYYRRTRAFELLERTPEAMAPMFEHMNSLSNAMLVSDTQAMLQYVDAQPAADARRIGAVGYCMSGPFVFAAAAAYPDRIQAIAAIHGANMVTERDDSPHRMAARIKAETYVACAEIDKWAPPDQVQVLEDAMKVGGMKYRLEWYPKAEHGFVFPRRAGIYNRDAAERHWERLLALFERNLKR